MQILIYTPEKNGRVGHVVAKTGSGREYSCIIRDGKLRSAQVRTKTEPSIWWCSSFIGVRVPRKAIMRAITTPCYAPVETFSEACGTRNISA